MLFNSSSLYRFRLCQNTGEEELSDCEDGELNVVGGRNSGEGLLKICHQQVWGTICGNNWDVNTDSVVACRQLGFNRSGVYIDSSVDMTSTCTLMYSKM